MMSWSGENPELERAALAMEGYIADQKAVLYFHPDPEATEFMARFTVEGDVVDVHKAMIEGGLAFHTLRPTSEGTVVYVYGQDQETLDKATGVARDQGAELAWTAGKGEFIGTKLESGTDREQRDDARRAYEEEISVAAGGEAGHVWEELRDRWTRRLEQSQDQKVVDDISGPFEEKEGSWLMDPDGKLAGSTSAETSSGGGGEGHEVTFHPIANTALTSVKVGQHLNLTALTNVKVNGKHVGQVEVLSGPNKVLYFTPGSATETFYSGGYNTTEALAAALQQQAVVNANKAKLKAAAAAIQPGEPDIAVDLVGGSDQYSVKINGQQVGTALKNKGGGYHFESTHPALANETFKTFTAFKASLAAKAGKIAPATGSAAADPASVAAFSAWINQPAVEMEEVHPDYWHVKSNGETIGTAELQGSGAISFSPVPSFTIEATATAQHIPTTASSPDKLVEALTEIKGQIAAAAQQLAANKAAAGLPPAVTTKQEITTYQINPTTWAVHAEGKLVGHASQASTGKVHYQPGNDPMVAVQVYASFEKMAEALSKPPLTKKTVEFKKGASDIHFVEVNGKKVGVALKQWSTDTVIYTAMGGNEQPQEYESWDTLKAYLEGPAPQAGERDDTYTPPPIHHSIAEPAAKVPLSTLPEPLVRTDGGQWNQETSIRLAKEHAARKDAINKDMTDIVLHGATVNAPAGTWEDLASHDQQSVEEEWKSSNKHSEVQQAEQDWHENFAEGEAKATVANDFNNKDDWDWAEEAVDNWLADREEDGKALPYDRDQILEALHIEADTPDQTEVWFHFDRAKLIAKSFVPEQQTLPGVQPLEGHEAFNTPIEGELTSVLETAFQERVQERIGDMTPPDWVAEQADQTLDDIWSQMDDDEKYEWGKMNNLLGDDTESEQDVVMPDHLDPLNDNVDENYRQTQRLAKALSVERAAEVITERGLGTAAPEEKWVSSSTGPGHWVTPEQGAALRARVSEIDDKLWAGWVSSSTGPEGVLLQLAAAEELGGRINEDRLGNTAQAVREQADQDYGDIGGYEGIKAYVRAKWEVTQELLDRAGIQELPVYRAIHMPDLARSNPGGKVDGHIERNGLASFSSDIKVGNGWGGDSSRIMLRALVPRTAIISVPAFGKNIHSEHEVVVAGTGWTGWDAYSGIAPSHSETPIPIMRGTTEEQAQWEERKKAA